MSSSQTSERLLPLLTLLVLVLCTSLAACGGGEPEPASDPASAPDSPSPPADTPSAAPAPTGSARITGTIRYQGEVPNLRPLQMDADPKCAAKHSGPVMPEVLVLGDGQTLANIFVSVRSGLPEGSYPVPSEPVVMDQQGCVYTPHVMGVRVGQTFKVLNSDGLLHNVHSLSKVNSPFNRAMPGTVTETEYTFDKEEGMFKVKCDVHPWMAAFIGVVDHPYFAVTGTDGSFEIAGLPAGTYEIEAWHERFDAQTATVTVGDGEAVISDFTFSRP